MLIMNIVLKKAVTKKTDHADLSFATVSFY